MHGHDISAKIHNSEHLIILHNLKAFIPDTDCQEVLPHSLWSAVFLVEDNNSVSCIGILIAGNDSSFLFALIHDILDTFSHELGQSVVIETFENKKVWKLFLVSYTMQRKIDKNILLFIGLKTMIQKIEVTLCYTKI
jgi:hypothetical protein